MKPQGFSIAAATATLMAVAAPILYLYGNAFYSGWLSGWGLTTGLFPISFESALTHGWLVAAMNVNSTVIRLGLAIILLATLTIIFALVAFFSPSFRNYMSQFLNAGPDKSKEQAKDQKLEDVLSFAENTFERLKTYSVPALVACLFLLLSLLLWKESYEAGEDVAALDRQQFIDGYKSKTLAEQSIITLSLSDGSKIKVSKMITCGSTHCAFIGVDGYTQTIPITRIIAHVRGDSILEQ